MTVGRIVDVSSNDHPDTQPITWPKVAKAGVTTALIKATQGTGYTNPWYHRDTGEAQAAGIDTLAYHFAGFDTAAKEAAFFQSVAGLEQAKICDSETSTRVAWINTFLQTLGTPPTRLLTYGSASALSGIGGQLRSMLWVAAYGQGYPGYGVLWQFTDKATIPGIKSLVDESRWYGTDEQYDRLFGKFDPPPPVVGTKGHEMIAATSTGNGYWQTKPTGAVYAFGDATYHGGANTGALGAGDAIVGIAGHGTDGYWLSAASGAVFAYGSATYHGGYNEPKP